jgi:nucleotide-binding universal stress UspA family protein
VGKRLRGEDEKQIQPHGLMGVRDIKKVVLAIDALSENEGLEAHSWESLGAFLQNRTHQGNVQVEPVFVWGEPEIPERDENGVTLEIKRKMRELLRGSRLPGLKSPRIIHENLIYPPELRDQVDTLVAYARRTDADLIALHTKAKSGAERVLLGSFGEMMIHRSDVPLFMMNPLSQTVSRVKTLFFATDLEAPSKKVFAQVIARAHHLDARVILFHHVFGALFPSAKVRETDTRYFLEKQKNEVNEVMESWVDWASAQGVRVESLLDESDRKVREAILKESEAHGADVIVMVSQSGYFTGKIFGSDTRNIVRQVKLPVWVLHPPLATESDALRRRRKSADITDLPQQSFDRWKGLNHL